MFLKVKGLETVDHLVENRKSSENLSSRKTSWSSGLGAQL
jgi:hypothetical protein